MNYLELIGKELNNINRRTSTSAEERVKRFRDLLAKEKYANLETLDKTSRDLLNNYQAFVWQDSDTMSKNIDTVQNTLTQLSGYREHLKSNYGNDENYAETISNLEQLETGYKSGLDMLNSQAQYFSQFDNAEDFNKKYALDKQNMETISNYEKLRENADFAEKAVYNENLLPGGKYFTSNESPWAKLLGGGSTDAQKTYKDVNVLKGQSESAVDNPNYAISNALAPAAGNNPYSTLTLEELNTYNYIANTQGIDEADKYIQLLRESVNARKGKEIADGFYGLPIINLGTSFASGLDSSLEGIENAINSISNPNQARETSAMQYAGGFVQQKADEAGWIFGQANKVAQSIGQMLPSIYASVATGNIGNGASSAAKIISKFLSNATLGISVYGNAYNEALQQGEKGWDAYGKGLINAGIEVVAENMFDALPGLASGSWASSVTKKLGKLGKALDNIGLAMEGSSIAQIAKSGLEEGFEEVFSGLLTPIVEGILLGEDIKIDAQEIFDGFITGALTAGVMSAPGEISTSIKYSTLNKDIAQGKTEASFDDVLNASLTMDESTKSYKLANQISQAKDKKVGNTTKKALLKTFEEETQKGFNKEIADAFEDFSLDKLSETSKTRLNMRMEASERTIAERKLKKNADNGMKYTSAEGNTAISADGTELNFDEYTYNVKRSKDGELVFENADGKKFSTNDSALPADVYLVAEASKSGLIPDSALTSYFKNAPKTTSESTALTYALDFEKYYRAGANAEPIQFILENTPESGISLRAAESIYEAGFESRKTEIADRRLKIENAKKAASKDGKVVYKKGKVDDSAIKKMTLSEEQLRAVEIAKVLSELGINIKFFASTTAERHKGTRPNGAFDAETGTIEIDINAGTDEKLIGSGVFWAMSHEVTHLLKQTAPEQYDALKSYILETLYPSAEAFENAVAETLASHYRRGIKLDREGAIDEIVARSCENMFKDSDALSELFTACEQKKQGFAQTLYNCFKDFIDKVVSFFKNLSAQYDSNSTEARFFKENADKFEKLKKLWKDAFAEGMENVGIVYGATDISPNSDGVATSKDGEPIAASYKNGSAVFSIRTYEDEGRTLFINYLDKCVKSKRLTSEQRTEMIEGLDEIYRVCVEFKDKYAPFSKWSDAAVVRDTHGRPVFSVVTPNGDYKMNLDFSLVCKKRRTLDAVFNEMARRGIIDDFELGQKSVVKINELIRKHGFETACALCFVDAKRFRQASMADSFVSLYNELVYSLVPESDADKAKYFNFSGNLRREKTEGGIDTLPDSSLDFSHINHVLNTYESGTVEYKAAKYIKETAEARKLLQRGDFMSSSGFDAVKKQNQKILSLYNSKKGTGGPKAAFGDVQYLNEIIQKARYWTPAKAYAVGGIRIQSFSDYVPRMIFDYVQMVYDLAANQLPAHAYSKEALFVKQFGLTGIKINMSLIPAVAKDGIAPGLDKDGNYVWAGESFNYETAKDIQNAEGYTDNCGTICVGVSDAHIRKLLSDDNIRMVIPYHKSGLNPIVAHMNKISKFKDYTGNQNTLGADGKKLEKDFDFNKRLHSLGEKGDPRSVANEYLEMCDRLNYTPKFSQFRDHPNYYKLLVDFTVYNKDGVYVPQRGTSATFPTKSSAFGSMKALIESGLEEDAVIEGKRDTLLSKIVDEIESSIPRTEAEIENVEVDQAETDIEAVDSGKQYSLRDQNNARIILSDVLASSELTNKYYEKKFFLQEYQAAQTSYNKALEKIEQIEADIRELPRGHTQNSKVKRLNNSLNTFREKLQKADEKLFTYEAESLRDVIDAELKRRAEEGVSEGKRILNEYKKTKREQANLTMQRARIETAVKKTLEYLRADEKHTNVPSALRNDLISFLQAIDFRKVNARDNTQYTKSSTAFNEKIEGLKPLTEGFDAVIKRMKEIDKGDEATTLGVLEISEDVIKELEEAHEKIKQWHDMWKGELSQKNNIYEMDINTITALAHTLRMINHIIVNANKAIASGINMGDLASNTIMYLSEKPDMRKKDDALSSMSSSAKKTYFLLVDPVRGFKNFGEGGIQIFKQLQEADSTRGLLIQKVKGFVSENFASKISEWRKENHQFDLDILQEDGTSKKETIEATTPQLMALYCHWQRDQSRKHLEYKAAEKEKKTAGGGVFKTTLSSGENAYSSTVHFTQEVYEKLTSVLTEDQIKVANLIQDFMSNFLANLGNAVTLKRYGLLGFLEEHYMPIEARRYNSINEEQSARSTRLTALINKSFTKHTNENANNTIVISDLFDVFGTHAAEMIDYYAFALPIIDTLKWLNYSSEIVVNNQKKESSVIASIDKAFGKNGISFVTQLVTDINGSSSRPSGGIGIQQFLLRNTKVALVGGKVKQAFLQPTSTIRAMSELGVVDIHKAIGKLVVNENKGNFIAEIKRIKSIAVKYSGEAAWKSMGYLDINMSAQTVAEKLLEGENGVVRTFIDGIKDKNLKKSYKALQDASLKTMEWGDDIGWAIMWKACELNIQKNHTDIAYGTNAFYKLVAEKFRDVIYKTQVYDSVIAKPAILRSKNTLTNMTVSFMGEPIKSANMLLESVLEFNEDRRKYGFKGAMSKNGPKMLGLCAIMAYQAVIVGAINAVVKQISADEEDEEILDPNAFLEKWMGYFFDEINILKKIPFVSEMWDIVVEGYDASRLDLESVSSLGSTIRTIRNLIAGKGKKTGWGVTMQIIETLSQVSGLPAENVTADIVNIINLILELLGEDKIIEKK